MAYPPRDGIQTLVPQNDLQELAIAQARMEEKIDGLVKNYETVDALAARVATLEKANANADGRSSVRARLLDILLYIALIVIGFTPLWEHLWPSK